ncbi:hypothetical Protein pso3_02290 [Candidatus Phytoplasma solani]
MKKVSNYNKKEHFNNVLFLLDKLVAKMSNYPTKKIEFF